MTKRDLLIQHIERQMEYYGTAKGLVRSLGPLSPFPPAVGQKIIPAGAGEMREVSTIDRNVVWMTSGSYCTKGNYIMWSEATEKFIKDIYNGAQLRPLLESVIAPLTQDEDIPF